jgi:mRNA-degrading endonuclease RelE of RelBE toxin-antitoxin system
MTANIVQKNQILESLHALDQDQAQQVLTYIKGLLNAPQEEITHEKFKREAMKEIRQALNKRRMNTPF